jgi:hypothetical protein
MLASSRFNTGVEQETTMFMRLAFVACLLSMALQPWPAHVNDANNTMPTVQAESLAGVAMVLPRDLPAERTVVMIGFEFDHQAVMDDWLAKMALRDTQKPWLQLHGIGQGYGWLSGFINSRKRPYFKDTYLQERVVPVYIDVRAFLVAMGLADSQKAVFVMVVQRDGKVLAKAQGAYSPAAATALMAALAGG